MPARRKLPGDSAATAFLWRYWNWKAAVFGALFRANLFFAANLTSGTSAALGAACAELAYRVLLCGFQGALTQRVRNWRPAWAAPLWLPLISHAVEFAVHRLRGTPNLRTSVAVSISFTVLATTFNLHAMRRGALLAGEGETSLRCDLARMPRLAWDFVRRAALGQNKNLT